MLVPCLPDAPERTKLFMKRSSDESNKARIAAR
jgi:hypothetical protein